MGSAMVLYAHLTDNELIDKIKKGYKVCFEVLVRRHSQALYRIGRMFGLKNRIVEDLICDAHTVTFQKISKFENGSSYRQGLIAAMINKCKLKLRTDIKLSEPEAAATDPSSKATRSSHHYSDRLVPSHGFTNKLEYCIDRLPVQLRTAYVMCKIEGFTVPETAALLQISESTVMTYISQAKISLDKFLKKWQYQSDVYSFDHDSNDRVVSKLMELIDTKESRYSEFSVPRG